MGLQVGLALGFKPGSVPGCTFDWFVFRVHWLCAWHCAYFRLDCTPGFEPSFMPSSAPDLMHNTPATSHSTTNATGIMHTFQHPAMSFLSDGDAVPQSSMATQGSHSNTRPEDTAIQAAFRNATPFIMQLFLAEIENLDASGDGQTDEAYVESLAELKHAVELICKPRGNKQLARL
ncbi:hypothetical protein FACUT_4304 [Fusarium acutatum]|uniref:Uncharacterized protein n=1 Tax=Fusarium acutatum TaxID=78861 RepID=A0A8H4JWV7_9HYPO|nr:hypothetical protein FACUT_4304 [Fusarium acutatum]